MQKIPARILVVDDDPDILTAARVVLKQEFDTVTTEQNLQRLDSLLRQTSFDVILLDMNFAAGINSGNEGLFWLRKILSSNPTQKIVLITAYSDVQLAVEGMKAGAADFIVKPWDNERLVKTVKNMVPSGSPKQDFKQKGTVQDDSTIIGTSAKIQSILDTLRKVAPTDASILLLGENGTGKELLSRFIHQNSARKNRAFAKVDLGALTATLFESELFGHKKGAFTDAKEDRQGRFQLASGGTLFMDEVGNVPLNLQVKLLTAIQSGRVTPVGSNENIPVDVRLISATNLDIHAAVSRKEFREDLLYRINTIEIVLPPLRERKDDIPALVDYFIRVYSNRYSRHVSGISRDALPLLKEYPWPGNIRELQHAIERAVIMSDHATLEAKDLLLGRKNIVSDSDSRTMDELERDAIVKSIDRNDGNLSKVALELGVGRTTLYRKMEKYGITK